MRNTAIGMFMLLAALHHGGCKGAETGDGGGANPGMPEGGPGPIMPGGGSDPGMPGSGFMVKIPGENTAFFDGSSIIRIDLSFTAADWAELLAIHASGAKDENYYVHCGFTFQGQTYNDAGCRPKGRAADWPAEPKPQLAVVFNHWNPNGEFLKLQRVNLEFVPYNPAPVRDRLGMLLMQKAGLHAPRVNHARVYVNGEYLGLYQNLEQIEKPFLDYQFQDPSGNLYTDGDILWTNQQTGDKTRLWDLGNLVTMEPLTGDHTQFFTQLNSTIDVHSMILLTASEIVLPACDNWANGSANFFQYDDPLTKRFIYMPWDLDSWLEVYSPPDSPIYDFTGVPGNQPNKMLQLAFQNPAWKKEYEDTLVALRDGPYSALPPEVTAVCSQIRTAFIEDPHKLATVDDFDRDCQNIKDGIAERIAFLKGRLGR